MDKGNFFNKLDSFFKNGDIRGAESFLIESIEAASKEKNLPALLSMANELGGILRVTGRFSEARKIYEIARLLVHMLGLDQTPEYGTTLLNLGAVHNEMDEAQKALELYKEAENLYIKAGLRDDYQMAALNNNMSHSYHKLGNYEEALRSAQKSLDIIRNFKGHDIELATSCTTLATRFAKLGRDDEAWKYLKEAEELFLKVPGKPDIHFASTLNAMGEISARKGRMEEAATYFEKALEIIAQGYGKNKTYHSVLENLNSVKSQGGKKETVYSNDKACRTNGLEMSKMYYRDWGKHIFEDKFPNHIKYMAVGLVGEGSECFGFDDETSESHDYGPGFCIWLPHDIYSEAGKKMQEVYESLPKEYMGRRRVETAEGAGRVGVFSIDNFYKKYIGSVKAPKDMISWLLIPETSLATVTNGQVFFDNYGEFSKIRNELLNFYPRDVFLKKLAAKMAMMSQGGQYNYERSIKRGDYGAAYLSCTEFVKNAISLAYLMNQKYMPFYKWMFKGMEEFSVLKDMKKMLIDLISQPDTRDKSSWKINKIEEISILVRDELEHQGLITGKDSFLNLHCMEVMSRISDSTIRSLPVMFDGK